MKERPLHCGNGPERDLAAIHLKAHLFSQDYCKMVIRFQNLKYCTMENKGPSKVLKAILHVPPSSARARECRAGISHTAFGCEKVKDECDLCKVYPPAMNT